MIWDRFQVADWMIIGAMALYDSWVSRIQTAVGQKRESLKLSMRAQEGPVRVSKASYCNLHNGVL